MKLSPYVSHLRLYSLLLLWAFIGSADAGTLTVSADKGLSNPDILAYNLGHFYEGSNTHDWWRYSGVNGARIFISPATLEASDDIIVGSEGEFGGDGVTDLTGFLARKAALRADPLNLSYINWTYFNDRYETKLFGSSSSGNRFTVNHALTKLHELDIDILVQATAKESHLPITGSGDWAGIHSALNGHHWKDEPTRFFVRPYFNLSAGLKYTRLQGTEPI